MTEFLELQFERFGDTIENPFRHQLARWINAFEGDDAFIRITVERIVRVRGVQADRVIELLDVVLDENFEAFEIADHVIFIELIRLHGDLDAAAVAVREATLSRVL